MPIKSEGRALKGFASSHFPPSPPFACEGSFEGKSRKWRRRCRKVDRSIDRYHRVIGGLETRREGFLWRPIAGHSDKFLSRHALRTFSDRVSILIFFRSLFKNKKFLFEWTSIGFPRRGSLISFYAFSRTINWPVIRHHLQSSKYEIYREIARSDNYVTLCVYLQFIILIKMMLYYRVNFTVSELLKLWNI